MSYENRSSFVTETGCKVTVWENKGHPVSRLDGIYLHMAVDVRSAELKLEQEEARKLAKMLYPPRMEMPDEDLIRARDAVLEHRMDLKGRCMCGKFKSDDTEKIAMHLVYAVVEELEAGKYD